MSIIELPVRTAPGRPIPTYEIWEVAEPVAAAALAAELGADRGDVEVVFRSGAVDVDRAGYGPLTARLVEPSGGGGLRLAPTRVIELEVEVFDRGPRPVAVARFRWRVAPRSSAPSVMPGRHRRAA